MTATRKQVDRPHLNLPNKEHPTVFARLSPAQPTVVYESFWQFAAERQKVFFRKMARSTGTMDD